MELDNIEKLIEKYLNAETTLQEENTLREYFTTSQNVPPHLHQFTALFQYFKKSKNETYTHTIKLKPKKVNKRKQWLSAVASVVLVIGGVMGKQAYEKQQQRKQFAQIKQALEMVSINLNKGNDALYAVSNNLAKGNDAINKLNTLPKTINKANKILSNNNY